MTFIIIFTILSLAFPLSFEIKKKGRDNTLMRSGSQLVDFTKESFSSITKRSKKGNYINTGYKSQGRNTAISLGYIIEEPKSFSNKLKEKLRKLLNITYIIVLFYVIYITMSFVLSLLSFILNLIF